MATSPIEVGPVGRRVASTLRSLRRQADLHQRDLSSRLAELGRPMSASTISKIEKMDRRVDVDDLVAFSRALGVTPSTLLGDL